MSAHARSIDVPSPPVHTDWLHHRLSVAGPAETIAAFREAARGAGVIPWRLDLDRMEEDWFHLLISPPPPHRRTLSAEGARILAAQLRDAVMRRHELAASRVDRSRACPFDLHALIAVPDDVLMLGPDDPGALDWLWTHWGTMQPLRHVAEDAASTRDGTAASFIFWSADWTPWRALGRLAEHWTPLRFDARPTYGA